MRRIVQRWAAAAVLLMGLMGVAWAQTERTGTIEGVVKAAGGGIVPDASVTVAQPDGSYARTVLSDAKGAFRVGFLPPGTYNLAVQAEGFADLPTEGLRVSAAQTTRIVIEMKGAGLTQEINVIAAAPKIDTQSPDRGTVLSSERIDEVPLPRRSTALLELVPGVSEDRAFGASSTQANNYQIDGVTVNQPGFGGSFLLPNPDWIEEFQVRGLGAGAEYGNFQGAVVNIVTKSGSNTFRGGVRSNYESSSWNASNSNALEAGTDLDRRWEVNADVAGPLVKDKLFFFVSLQEAQIDDRVTDLFNSTASDLKYLADRQERTERKALVKLTWQATPKDRFDMILGRDEVDTDRRGLDSFTEPIATSKQDSPSTFYNFSWSRGLTTNQFIELKATGYSGRDDRTPYRGNLPAVEQLGGDSFLFANAIYTRTRKPTSNGVAINWDSYWNTGSVKHQLKVGADIDKGEWREGRRRNGNLTWRPDADFQDIDPADPSTWGFISSDWGGDIDLRAKTDNSALYVQDYLTIIPRVSVAAGLRYGRWKGQLTPGFGSGSTFDAVSDNAVDPRLGVVFDTTGQKKWVVNAHWGRYHQSLFALMFDRVDGGNAFQDLEFWDWAGTGLPDPARPYTLAERESLFEFFDSEPTGEQVGRVVDYKQPYVDQLVLGVDFAPTSRLKFSLAALRRENKQLLALVDRNLASNYTEYRNVRVLDQLDANGNPLVLSQLFVSNDDILFEGEAPGLTPEQIDALTFNQDFVLTTAPSAKRKLDQVILSGESFGGSVRLRGSITWSQLKGNFDSVSGYSDGVSGTGAGPYVRPNEAVNFDGRLPGLPQWVVKTDGSFDLPWKLRLGYFARWESGEYETPTFTIDRRRFDYETASGDPLPSGLLFGVNRQVVFVEARGSKQLPSFYALDLSLDRRFELSHGMRLTIAADLFNVTNQQRVRERRLSVNDQDPNDPSTLFGAPRLRQAPRGARLTASLRWN